MKRWRKKEEEGCEGFGDGWWGQRRWAAGKRVGIEGGEERMW